MRHPTGEFLHDSRPVQRTVRWQVTHGQPAIGTIPRLHCVHRCLKCRLTTDDAYVRTYAGAYICRGGGGAERGNPSQTSRSFAVTSELHPKETFFYTPLARPVTMHMNKIPASAKNAKYLLLLLKICYRAAWLARWRFPQPVGQSLGKKYKIMFIANTCQTKIFFLTSTCIHYPGSHTRIASDSTLHTENNLKGETHSCNEPSTWAWSSSTEPVVSETKNIVSPVQLRPSETWPCKVSVSVTTLPLSVFGWHVQTLQNPSFHKS